MNNRKKELQILIDKFDRLYQSGNFDKQSEASARTWVENFLKIFGWDVSNPFEISQESRISQMATERMSEIESTHKIPDYALMCGERVLAYLDVKRIDIDISSCKDSAFQIRSYGWSSGTPSSFVTNFKEMAIFDSRHKPDKKDSADKGRVYHLKYNDYINNFDVLEKHFSKDSVQKGELSKIYSQHEQIKGSKTLDEDFSELLGKWRLIFANEIYKRKKMDVHKIQDYVQKILDRVLFLRVAEGKNIEEFGSLKNISPEGDLHKKILSLCKNRFDSKYDGYLFGDMSEDEDYCLSDNLLKEFIQNLYFPFPYRFEVIPTEIFGNMYEQYLGKRLVEKRGHLIDDFKPEYQKTRGAIYTPKYIVDAICFNTLKGICSFEDIESILKLNILDMSCGSGSFLLGIFDYLENRIKTVIKNKHVADGQYDGWFWINPKNNRCYLTALAKRKIISACIYGIDIDSQAVEIAKLSLALKVVEGSESNPSEILGLQSPSPRILSSIDKNIKNGNSLVDRKIFDLFPELIDKHESLEKIKVFDWDEDGTFKNVMLGRGGFDAIVGNPPYVETKHYKEENPYLHKLLTLPDGKRFYKSAAGGKIDVAIPFIERGVDKLNKNGRLGYIVQSRFFKTDYGKAARKHLCENTYLESIMDFGEAKIFKGRNTYTAILTCSKTTKQRFKYKKITHIEKEAIELNNFFENAKSWHSFKYSNMKHGSPWNFSNPELLKLLESLCERHRLIKDQKNINLKVGLQVTWDKVYHLKPMRETAKHIIGKNGLNNEIKIEREACRPTVCNERLYPFASLKANVYSIFPYDIIDSPKGKKAQEILFSDFKKRYPLAGKYLLSLKDEILQRVKTVEGDQEWHLYPYPKNLAAQNQAKIIFPTTICDTAVSVDEKGEFYQDNVRIYSLIVDSGDVELYQSIASILNSDLFNYLAKVTCNPLQGGHIQFNKQFIEQIPLPEKIFTEQPLRKKLADIGQDIFSLQIKYLQTPRLQNSIEKSIKEKWRKLNIVVESDLYELKESEKSIYNSFPPMDRFGYFLSQVKRTQ